MKKLPEFDYNGALDFITEEEIESVKDEVLDAHKKLSEGTGAGNDFIGWLDLPYAGKTEELKRVKKCAAKIRKDSEYLIVIGIGGSYLGARAAIDMLSGTFYREKNDGVKVLFAGNSLSPSYLADLIDLVEGHDVSLNVISKSGTTLEPAVSFRILRGLMEKKYGAEAAKRIYATTDKKKGVLHDLSVKEGYEMFEVPDNVGGRYSVLTPVGLLPIAAAGFDIDDMLSGARDASESYKDPELFTNPCYTYAAVRNLLYRKGKKIEIMANFEPKFHNLTEWWKQLYGESEGKDGKGIFPAGVDFSTDLHSMGQYIQDGERTIFETVISAEKPARDYILPWTEDDEDKLNYIAGKGLDYINKTAAEGTKKAHISGGVPNLAVKMADMSEYSFGATVFFFEKACAISGYMLGVNPFNQPGVEAYKKNMFALLGRE